MVTLPDYLHGRLSLTEDESHFSAFLSSRRVVNENYHGRVKRFQGLHFKLDMRVATTFGRELWAASTYLCHRNYAPLRQAEKREEESDFLACDEDQDNVGTDYESFLNSIFCPRLTETSESSDESSSSSPEFVPHASSSSSDEIVISDDCNNFQQAENELNFESYRHSLILSTDAQKILLNQTPSLQIPKPSRAEKFVKPMPQDPGGLSEPLNGTISDFEAKFNN